MWLRFATLATCLSALNVLAVHEDTKGTTVYKKIEYPEPPSPEPCPFGCKGLKGEKGVQGRPGRHGNPGERGYRGPPAIWPPWPKDAALKGARGDKGDDGVDGRSGAGGDPGDAGNPGSRGVDGENGAEGSHGRPGAPGAPGSDGDQGRKGGKGARGVEGTKGARGDKGVKGAKGTPGLDGTKGAKGVQGDDGEDGRPGAKGARGVKGEMGVMGNTGGEGPIGSGGRPGAKGRDGARGQTGKKGVIGKTGNDGKKGKKGETGPSIDTISINADVCTGSLEGQVRYEPNRNLLYYCDGSEWRCLRDKPCSGVTCEQKLKEGELLYRLRTKLRSACVAVIIDESGSMRNEQSWLPNTIQKLEKALLDVSIGSRIHNLYAMVGFGLRDTPVRLILHNGLIWYNAADLLKSAEQLRHDGELEDGFYAIKYAIENIQFPSNCVKHFILMTDEARKASSSGVGLTAASTLKLLQDNNITLNVIANIALQLNSGADVFAVTSEGNSFGVGRSNTFISYSDPLSVAAGASFCQFYKDYGEMALRSGGAVWDIETLRKAQQADMFREVFTAAFAEVKKREIVAASKVCQQCVCADSGFGQPELQCSEHSNKAYCNCRVSDGETDESCQRFENGASGAFDPGTLAPDDCSVPE